MNAVLEPPVAQPQRSAAEVRTESRPILLTSAQLLRGQRLVVDLTSGVSKMDQGRVEGLFQAGSRNPEKK